MKKLLLGLLFAFPSLSFAANGTVTVIDKIAPKNGAFVGVVDASQTVTNVTNFNNNLSPADTDVQKALETIDNLSFGGTGDMILASTQTMSAPHNITNATTSPAMKIIQTGNTGTSDGTGGAFVVDVTSNTGYGIQVYTDRVNGTQLTGLLTLVSGSTSYDEPMIYIRSQSTGTVGANADMRIDANNPDLEFVETDQVAPAGKFEIAVQSDVLQFNSRNAANNSFQAHLSMNHAGALRFKEGDNGGDFVAFIATNTMSGSTTWTLPAADGTSGQVLTTNGSGDLSFTTASGGGGSGSGGYNVEPATVTFQLSKGVTASTATFSTMTVTSQAIFQNVSTTTFQNVSAMTFGNGSSLIMSSASVTELGILEDWNGSVGTANQVLTSNGSSFPPTWQTVSGGGGGGGAAAIAVGTGTASNFTTLVSSPTQSFSFLGSQFRVLATGTTAFISAPGFGDTFLNSVVQTHSSTDTWTQAQTFTANSTKTHVPITINSQNATAGKNGLRVNSSGNGTGVYINQSGSTPDVVDQGALSIVNTGNIGFGETLFTNQGADQRNPLFQMQGTNQAYGTYFMMLSNAATNFFSTTIEMQAPIPSIEFRGLPLSQAPVDEFQISERLDELRLEGRKQDNTGFDAIMTLQRPTAGAPTSNGLVLIERGGYHNPINPLDVAGEVAIGRGYAKVSTAPTNGLIVQGSVGISTKTPVNTLAVAGGAIITSSLTVVGSSYLEGNVGINTMTPIYPLTVGGNAIISGQLITTTFVADTMETSTITVSDKLIVIGGINTETSGFFAAPAVSSCGSSASIETGSTDTNGKINVGSGAVSSCTLTFGTARGKAPACVVNSNTAIISQTVATTTTALTVGGTSLTSDVLTYICFGNE